MKLRMIIAKTDRNRKDVLVALLVGMLIHGTGEMKMRESLRDVATSGFRIE